MIKEGNGCALRTSIDDGVFFMFFFGNPSVTFAGLANSFGKHDCHCHNVIRPPDPKSYRS